MKRVSFALPQIFLRWGRAPEVRRQRPHFRLLGAIAVPRPRVEIAKGPRVEIAKGLVEHLIEFGEHLDNLVVGIAVVGVNVVARTVASGSRIS